MGAAAPTGIGLVRECQLLSRRRAALFARSHAAGPIITTTTNPLLSASPPSPPHPIPPHPARADPLKAFDYAHPSPVESTAILADGRPKPRPLLLFLPPVVGNALAPFAQYPHLDRVFDVRAFKTDLGKRWRSRVQVHTLVHL